MDYKFKDVKTLEAVLSRFDQLTIISKSLVDTVTGPGILGHNNLNSFKEVRKIPPFYLNKKVDLEFPIEGESKISVKYDYDKYISYLSKNAVSFQLFIYDWNFIGEKYNLSSRDIGDVLVYYINKKLVNFNNVEVPPSLVIFYSDQYLSKLKCVKDNFIYPSRVSIDDIAIIYSDYINFNQLEGEINYFWLVSFCYLIYFKAFNSPYLQ